MKFYVNQVYDQRLRSTLGLRYGDEIIGLFKQCATDGRGNFCGYYASEYYIDTELYAYYLDHICGLRLLKPRPSMMRLSYLEMESGVDGLRLVMKWPVNKSE